MNYLSFVCFTFILITTIDVLIVNILPRLHHEPLPLVHPQIICHFFFLCQILFPPFLLTVSLFLNNLWVLSIPFTTSVQLKTGILVAFIWQLSAGIIHTDWECLWSFVWNTLKVVNGCVLFIQLWDLIPRYFLYDGLLFFVIHSCDRESQKIQNKLIQFIYLVTWFSVIFIKTLLIWIVVSWLRGLTIFLFINGLPFAQIK